MIKILLLDIENSPVEALVWGLWNQNIMPNQIQAPGTILSWAAKWLGKKELMYMDSRGGYMHMLKGMHTLLQEADAVVHYNGSRHDIPWLNKEFALHDLIPPAPFKQIDLLKTVKKNFKFPSNKMVYVCEQFGLGTKVQHKGMPLWTGCMAGDEASWATMERYNKQDVRLLEKLYKKLLPWIGNHPNVALYVNSERQKCIQCGHGDLAQEGKAYLKTGIYQRYRCKKCDKWQRGRSKLNDSGHPGMVSV